LNGGEIETFKRERKEVANVLCLALGIDRSDCERHHYFQGANPTQSEKLASLIQIEILFRKGIVMDEQEGFWIDFAGENTVILLFCELGEKFPIEVSEWNLKEITLSDLLLEANYAAQEFAEEEDISSGPQKINRSDGFQLAFILEIGTRNQHHFKEWAQVA
jgi:hypothetical protein